MTESAVNRSSSKENQQKRPAIWKWFRSSAFKCVLMDIFTFALILIIFFLVCVPKKYDLSVGSISHDTVNATKDVVDEVTTEEKRHTYVVKIHAKAK